MNGRLWPLLLLAIVVTGCGTAIPPNTPVPLPTPVATFTAIPTLHPSPSATTAAAPSPIAPPPTAALPTPLPSVTATPIPPVVRLALPPYLATAYQWPLNNADLEYTWHIVPDSDPATAVSAGRADIAVVAAEGPFTLPATPLVVAVPLTHEWEATTLERALAIAADGHSLARIVPWAEMVPVEKPLLIDGLHPTDPAYPLRQVWSLQPRVGFEDAAALFARLVAERPPADTVVHLAAVGDIMLDRVFYDILHAGRIDYPFAHVAAQLLGADITVGNVESSLGDIGTAAPKRYTFQAPPAAAEALAVAGFDVVSLANNHALDFGPEALLQGIALLQAAGVTPVGAGPDAATARSPHVTAVHGLTFAFLAYAHVPVEVSGFDTAVWTATDDTPGLAWGEPTLIAADVAAIAPTVDHTVVLLHSGLEYIEEPSEPQAAAARAAIDAGATLVIGHHSHILQGIEFYGGGVIVYGLGNFAFPIDGDPTTAVLHTWLDRDGVRQLMINPALIQADGRPLPATPADAITIRRRVYHLTNLLNPRSPRP